MSRRFLLVLACLQTACGGSTRPSTGLDALFDSERAASVAEAAPELWALAEDSRRRARGAEDLGDREAASDFVTEGRLLFAAAEHELSRSELSRRRLEVEEEILALTEAANEEEARRLELEGRIGREAASVLALSEAESMQALAEAQEPRRHRRHAEERRGMHRRAATVVVRRARLSLAAAGTFGADDAEVRALGERLDASSRATEPSDALGRADEVAAEISALLRRLRAGAELPAPEVARGLEEAALSAGFEVRREMRGMIISDEAFFGARSSRPVPARYEELLRLVRDHPVGAVRIEVYGPIDQQRRSRARADRLVRALGDDGVPSARLSADAVGSNATDDDGLRLDAVFVAYLHSVE